MPLIQVPRYFATQPQYPAPLISGGLARGLRGFWMREGDGDILPRNKVTGIKSVATIGTVTESLAPFGRAMSFNTSSIDTNDIVSIVGNELTIAVKVLFPTSTNTRIFGNHGSSTTGYLLFQNGLGISVYLDAVNVLNSSGIAAGTWGQFAFSFRNGASPVMLTAINGSVISSAGSVTVSAQSATVQLGAYNWPGYPDFSGQAEYFAVWDRGLSTSELQIFQNNPYKVIAAPDEDVPFTVGAPPAGGVTYVKVGGSWLPVATSYIKNGGVWKPTGRFVNVAGVWKPV